MIANFKVYKYMGYFFPIAVLSVIATGLPGAVALVFYWNISSIVKHASIKKLENEIATLDEMHREIILLIKLCNRYK